MTLIKLSADDLAALREGKIIERTGGPTIKIVCESAFVPRSIDVVKELYSRDDCTCSPEGGLHGCPVHGGLEEKNETHEKECPKCGFITCVCRMGQPERDCYTKAEIDARIASVINLQEYLDKHYSPKNLKEYLAELRHRYLPRK